MCAVHYTSTVEEDTNPYVCRCVQFACLLCVPCVYHLVGPANASKFSSYPKLHVITPCVAGAQLADEERVSFLIGEQRLQDLASHRIIEQQLFAQVDDLEQQNACLERLCSLVAGQLFYTVENARTECQQLQSDFTAAVTDAGSSTNEEWIVFFGCTLFSAMNPSKTFFGCTHCSARTLKSLKVWEVYLCMVHKVYQLSVF